MRLDIRQYQSVPKLGSELHIAFRPGFDPIGQGGRNELAFPPAGQWTYQFAVLGPTTVTFVGRQGVAAASEIHGQSDYVAGKSLCLQFADFEASIKHGHLVFL